MCRGPPAENVNAPVGNRTRVKPTLPEKGLRGLRRGLHHYTAWEGLTRPPRGLNLVWRDQVETLPDHRRRHTPCLLMRLPQVAVEGIRAPTAEPLHERQIVGGVVERGRSPNAQRVRTDPALGDAFSAGGPGELLMNLLPGDHRATLIAEQWQRGLGGPAFRERSLKLRQRGYWTDLTAGGIVIPKAPDVVRVRL